MKLRSNPSVRKWVKIMVNRIRVSIGTAIVLGLEAGPKNPEFTTGFFMTYSKNK